MLSHEAITEFKEIWFKQYSQELSDKEATTKATTLLNIFKTTYHQISKSENNHEL